MKYLLSASIFLSLLSCNSTESNPETTNVSLTDTAGRHTDTEPHRPQVHFTPATGWMNDPNGMLYHQGVYHLFYQHYPDSTVWGPMHWGHAISKDLMNWTHQPIALFPDSLGYIFSGSAVYDSLNTSGLGTNGKGPLVAIFTHHDPKGEKAGSSTYQNQSLAYSLDNGNTWTKYAGNPVLKSPGIKDFRDPKVAWHPEVNKWIMTLATTDRISFFSSPDLKQWTKESEFGQRLGAHGGVWECPDLFPLKHNGQTVWVLLVSINPGGPNRGSATQYFTGQFDGRTFTPRDTITRWIDHGPDDYAGVTFSGTGDRKVFLGWMSNWQYGNLVPTARWRSAMTLPRDLALREVNGALFLASMPSPEVTASAGQPQNWNDVDATDLDLGSKTGPLNGPGKLTLRTDAIDDYTVTLSNTKGEELVIGYEKSADRYFIDRSKSGATGFEKGFGVRHTTPRIETVPASDLTLLIDNASVELFADGGLSVMTEIFFPSEPYSKIMIRSPRKLRLRELNYRSLLDGGRSVASAK